MNMEIEKITDELFSRDVYELLDDPSEEADELYDALVEKAQRAIEKYGWDNIFTSWNHFMLTHCHNVQEALNFATLFQIYGGQNHKIEDPYTFLAPLYDIFDLCPVRYDAQIMDDVSYGLLEAAGIKKNLWSDDYYTTETDPKMIEAVEKLRKERLQAEQKNNIPG